MRLAENKIALRVMQDIFVLSIFSMWKRLVHPVLTGSKLPRWPRTIKPLRYENKKLQWHVRQRLDERCL